MLPVAACEIIAVAVRNLHLFLRFRFIAANIVSLTALDPF